MAEDAVISGEENPGATEVDMATDQDVGFDA
jgi:hypothetical protein